MSLKVSLDKFKKQQEKCQETLTSIAANSKPPALHTRTLPKNAVSVPIAKNVPAAKFSNDTERLQHINSIRKAPVGAQIKRVIDFLFQKREAYTAELLNTATHVDANTNKAVFDSLRKNPKVYYDGKRFSYKSKYDIQNKDQLLMLIRKFLEGIAVIDLKDSYPTVMQDLQALKAEGQIWLLSNYDSQEDIAYPNDPKFMLKPPVDEDLKQLFRGIELPRDMLDIEKDLHKNKMKPSTNTTKRRAMAENHGVAQKAKPKKKKKEINKRTKITNHHLPELFPHLQG